MKYTFAKYKISDDYTVVYIPRKYYTDFKKAVMYSDELIKYPFPFINGMADYHNDSSMVYFEFINEFPHKLTDKLKEEIEQLIVQVKEWKANHDQSTGRATPA